MEKNYRAELTGVFGDPVDGNPTGVVEEAAKQGAKTVNGLGMLVRQAALNFTLWTGVEAPVEIMEEALKKEL